MGFGWVGMGHHGLTRSDPEWVFWCKTHAKPMKNPLWVLSGHNGLTHLNPERDPHGLAIWDAALHARVLNPSRTVQPFPDICLSETAINEYLSETWLT